MLRCHMESIHVVQHAIPRLSHHREAPRRRPWHVVQRPANHLVMHHTNGVCVRDADRRGEEARFTNPLKAGHLAVSVQPMCPRKERVRRLLYSLRQDRRDTGPHWPSPTHELTLSVDNRLRRNTDARNVANRIARTVRKATDRDAEIFGALGSTHRCARFIAALALRRRGRLPPPPQGSRSPRDRASAGAKRSCTHHAVQMRGPQPPCRSPAS